MILFFVRILDVGDIVGRGAGLALRKKLRQQRHDLPRRVEPYHVFRFVVGQIRENSESAHNVSLFDRFRRRFFEGGRKSVLVAVGERRIGRIHIQHLRANKYVDVSFHLPGGHLLFSPGDTFASRHRSRDGRNLVQVFLRPAFSNASFQMFNRRVERFHGVRAHGPAVNQQFENLLARPL